MEEGAVRRENKIVGMEEIQEWGQRERKGNLEKVPNYGLGFVPCMFSSVCAFKLIEVYYLATRYSRMEQVKFVEDIF